MNGNKIFVRNLGDRLFSGKILTPKETLPDWHKTQKNNNFDKFPTLHHGFFLLFSKKKLISLGRSYTSPSAFIKMNKECFLLTAKGKLHQC